MVSPWSDDSQAYRFPVSVVGVVVLDAGVVLLQNPRGEWELPAGYQRSIQNWWGQLRGNPQIPVPGAGPAADSTV